MIINDINNLETKAVRKSLGGKQIIFMINLLTISTQKIFLTLEVVTKPCEIKVFGIYKLDFNLLDVMISTSLSYLIVLLQAEFDISLKNE